MRLRHLASLLVTSVLLLHAAPSRADDSSAEADASIGTTPAKPRQPVAADAPETARVAESADGRRPSHDAEVATDPPTDWAVLHAGLRPHLGTFGGLATFALAQARTERFYGVFSLAAVRNDAGTHVGLLQLALGRNLSDEFVGVEQLSLTENRARTFAGLGQTSLAYNRSVAMIGALQLSAFNRAKTFGGGFQLGAYNRADDAFTGIAQLGLFNHARGDFSGAFQLGVINGAGESLFEEHNGHDRRFAGLAQIGVVDSAVKFRGIAQIGAASFVGDDFAGGLQIGGLGAGARRFRGIAQLGLVTGSQESWGAQIGAGAIASEHHHGVQLGVLGNYARAVAGAQIGLANVAEEVHGVQIGLFNSTTRLRGVQIGLANHAEDGILPWTALLNMGFGDGDGGGTPDYDAPRDTAQRGAEPSARVRRW